MSSKNSIMKKTVMPVKVEFNDGITREVYFGFDGLPDVEEILGCSAARLLTHLADDEWAMKAKNVYDLLKLGLETKGDPLTKEEFKALVDGISFTFLAEAVSGAIYETMGIDKEALLAEMTKMAESDEPVKNSTGTRSKQQPRKQTKASGSKTKQ